MWHQWSNRNFTKPWKYFLCAKKTKIMTLFNNSSPLRHPIAPFCITYVNDICCSVLVAPYVDTLFMLFTLLSELNNVSTYIRCICCLRIYFYYVCNLCSEDERRSYGFGKTWGWVINDRIFIFGWTIPLTADTWLRWMHFYIWLLNDMCMYLSDDCCPVCLHSPPLFTSFWSKMEMVALTKIFDK